MLPLRRSDLTTRTVNGETVILDRDGQKVHRLNATASRVWEDCDGTKTPEDIAASLAAVFGMDSAVVLPDVREAIASLERLGLLAPPADS